MSKRLSGDGLASIKLAFVELLVGGLAVDELIVNELVRGRACGQRAQEGDELAWCELTAGELEWVRAHYYIVPNGDGILACW